MNGIVLIETRPEISKKAIIERHLDFLPGWDYKIVSDVVIKNWRDYNTLLTSVDFWKSIPFEKVIIVQHDSGILRTGIDEFITWDYVGAPWCWQHQGGNGGFSLRTKIVMQFIVERYTWGGMREGNEDVWFCNLMHREGIGELAPRKVCSKFSVEGIYQLGTFGYHDPAKWLNSEQVDKIMTQYE